MTWPPPPSSVETTIFPCRSASPTSRPVPRDVDVDAAPVGVPREHPVGHLPPLLGVLDPVHLRPGQAEAGAAAAVDVDDEVRERERARWRGSARAARRAAPWRSRGTSGSGSPPRARAACRRARPRARGRESRSTRPFTCSGWSSRARLRAAIWPSGSSPCTPPSTSAVGPSPPATLTIGIQSVDQPLWFDERGSCSTPNCFPGASRSSVQLRGEALTGLCAILLDC